MSAIFGFSPTTASYLQCSVKVILIPIQRRQDDRVVHDQNHLFGGPSRKPRWADARKPNETPTTQDINSPYEPCPSQFISVPQLTFKMPSCMNR